MISITITIQDRKARKSNNRLWFPDNVTLGQIQSFVDQYCLLLDPLIQGVIVSASMTRNLPLPGTLKVSSHDDADVAEAVRTSFGTTANTTASMTFATWDDALTQKIITTRERIPDLLVDEVVNFFNLITISDGTISPTDNRGNQINRIRKSRFVWK